MLSVRLSYSTILDCFRLQNFAGKNTENLPVGTVVSETVEALVSATRKMYGLPTVESDEAEELLKQRVKRVPGLDVGDFVAELTIRASHNGAEKEETRPDDLRQTTSKAKPEPPQQDEEKARVVELVNSVLEEVLEQQSSYDNEKLVESISAGSILRVSEEVAPPVGTRPPWELSEQLEPDDKRLLSDKLYLEAETSGIGLLMVATRVVYNVIPEKDWSSDQAIALVRSTYKHFKEWGDSHAKKTN